MHQDPTPFRNRAGTSKPISQVAASLVFAIGLAAFCAACTVVPILNEDELQVIYNRTAGLQYPDRNPVIVIPGSGGSRLSHRSLGKTWSSSRGDISD